MLTSPLLTSEQEGRFERNMVWLFCPRRSGSSWLGRQLLSHDTHYVNEPDITAHLDIPMQQGSNAQRRIDARAEIDRYFFSDKYREVWNYYLGKLIVNRVYAQVEDLEKKVIIKEASSLLDASDVLSDCTPCSKIIVLVRDGRDIIDSLWDGRQDGGWLARRGLDSVSGPARLPFIEHRCWYWNHQMQVLMKTYDKTPDAQRFLVRYEDLRSNTLEILHRIYRFIEVDIDERVLQELVRQHAFENIPKKRRGPGMFARFASPGKWEEHFSREEREKMNELMGDMLARLGYAV